MPLSQYQNDTILVFSRPIIGFCCVCSSKHEGLAGTRFGWGLFEDPALAQSVAGVVDTLTLGLSIDVELRVLASVRAIIGRFY